MRIRQGNDFIFLWAIERNGLPEDLSNAVNVRLHFKNFDCVGNVQSFQIVDGNIVRVEVEPKWASRLGNYRLILSYEFEDPSYSDGDRKCVVDVLAFNIVPKTSEADDIAEMAKTTDIMIGLSGLSAYEVWLKDNPDKTKEDYYNWLQEPATDIAETVGLQEQARVEAEELRVLAEQDRQSSTQEAISDAENAAETANTAAQNADDARLAIQDDLALKADHGYASNPKTLKEVDDDLLVSKKYSFYDKLINGYIAGNGVELGNKKYLLGTAISVDKLHSIIPQNGYNLTVKWFDVDGIGTLLPVVENQLLKSSLPPTAIYLRYHIGPSVQDFTEQEFLDARPLIITNQERYVVESYERIVELEVELGGFDSSTGGKAPDPTMCRTIDFVPMKNFNSVDLKVDKTVTIIHCFIYSQKNLASYDSMVNLRYPFDKQTNLILNSGIHDDKFALFSALRGEAEIEDIKSIVTYDVVDDDVVDNYIYKPSISSGGIVIADGTVTSSPGRVHMVSQGYISTEGLDIISVGEGYGIKISGYSSDVQEAYIGSTASYKREYSISEIPTYKYIKITVSKSPSSEMFEDDKELANLEVVYKIDIEGFDNIKSKHSSKILLTRGSLDKSGNYSKAQLVNQVNNDEPRYSEFFNNFRTSLFVNVDSRKLDTIETYMDFDSYTVKLFEFDNSFNLLKSSPLSESNKLSSATRYIKLSGSKIGGGKIDTIPSIQIKHKWGKNIYTYNVIPKGETTSTIMEVGNFNGGDVLDEFTQDRPDLYQDDNTPRYSHMIMHPPINYDAKGTPSRVIYFPPSATYYKSNNFGMVGVVEYFTSEGYFVVDGYTWDNTVAEVGSCYASPRNAVCINSMYKFLSDNFNIKRDGVFIFGYSHAGFQIHSAEYLFNFKVLAAAAFAAPISFLHKTTAYDYIGRDRLAKDVGVTEDTSPLDTENSGLGPYNATARAFLRRNASHYHGYLPMFMGSIGFDPIDAFPDAPLPQADNALGELEFTVISRVPIKSWFAVDDGEVRASAQFARKRAVERGSGIFEIRLLEEGTENPHNAPYSAAPKKTVTTKLGVVLENMSVYVIEVVEWLKRWEI